MREQRRKQWQMFATHCCFALAESYTRVHSRRELSALPSMNIFSAERNCIAMWQRTFLSRSTATAACNAKEKHTHLAHQHAMAMGIYIYIYSNDTSRRMHPDDKPDMLNSMLTGYLLRLLLFFSTIYFVSCAR